MSATLLQSGEEGVVVAGVNYLSTKIEPLKIDACRHTDKQPDEIRKWKTGYSNYLALMEDQDRQEFLSIMSEFGYETPNCFNCNTDLIKQIGNVMKMAGPKKTRIFTFFLDLFALGDWQMYTKQEVAKTALVFTHEEGEGKMFPLLSDSVLTREIQNFLNRYCKLEKQTDFSTLDEWLTGRGWANHGTASDVDPKLFSGIQNFMTRDKATLAYVLDDDLISQTDWDNKVFPKRDRKNRIIVVGSTAEYLIGSYVNKIFSESVITEPFKITNTRHSPNIENTIFTQLDSDKIAFPIDQSAFDQHQRKAAIIATRDWIVNKVKDLSGDIRLDELTKTRVETISHELFDKPKIWKTGLLSGKWYTSVAGSLLNAFEIWSANNGTWLGIEAPSLHQGDDAHICCTNLSKIEGMLLRTKELNIPVNASKNFIDVHRTDYLHAVYLTKTRIVKFGVSDNIARHQILLYPARGLTSWLWGDQENNKESTSAMTQASFCSKIVDRVHIINTRLNVNHYEKLLKTKLTDEEIDFVCTPTSFGGLGCLYIREPKVFRNAVGDGSITYYGFVTGFKGYTNAINQTKMMFPIDWDDRKLLSLIEAGLKYKKLPSQARAVVKKKFYNIRASGIDKRVYSKIKSKVLHSTIFTRKMPVQQLNLLPRPQLREQPPWAPAASLLIGHQEYWDAQSVATYQTMRRQGPFASKSWERGEISVSLQYSRRLNREQLSTLAKQATNTLLLWVATNRGQMLNPSTLRAAKLELETRDLHFANHQNEMFSSF